MWGRDVGLRLLLLLLPGSMGLECLSCGSDSGNCSGAEIVSCPIGSDVCVEALGAVAWSHGRLWLGGRGCGRGQPGGHARALQLAGLVLFSRRRQCREGRGCNAELPIGQQGALPQGGNESEAPPNGLSCFGCPDDGPCDSPHVVRCYGDLRACFHGNVSLTLGARRFWRELRGCARPQNCSVGTRGDEAALLSGHCCSGQLCNGPGPTNGSLFAPDLPRLQLLPHGKMAAEPPEAAANRTANGGDGGGANMAAGVGGGKGMANGVDGGGANMAAGGGGVNGRVVGVKGDVNGVNGSVIGDANMAAGVNGSVNGVNGDVNGGANMAAGVNGRVNGVNGDVNGGANMAAGVNGSVNGDVNGGTNMAAGGSGDVIGVKSDINKVNGSVNGDEAKSNMAAGGTGDVNKVKSEVNGDVNGDEAQTNTATGGNDVTTKMAAGRAGRPLEEPVGRGHGVGGAFWLLPLLLWPLL